MLADINKFQEDFHKLTDAGKTIGLALHEELDGKKRSQKLPLSFHDDYQNWYSEARLVVEQLLPQRLSEFTSLYEADPKRKQIHALNYTIADYLNGIRPKPDVMGHKPFDELVIFGRFQTQIMILDSIARRFESSLFEIKQLAQASLFDSELDAADELLRVGFLRASGAIGGVVLEKHLAQVCASHKVTVKKTDPTISELNDLLKGAGVIDVSTWRPIQRLSDLRNICVHNKNHEPLKEEVAELIAGVRKISKTLF